MFGNIDFTVTFPKEIIKGENKGGNQLVQPKRRRVSKICKTSGQGRGKTEEGKARRGVDTIRYASDLGKRHSRPTHASKGV